MKASVLVSLATAFLAAAPAAAQSIVFSSFADTKDDSQCSGSLGSVSVVTDIMDLMDDNGQYASPCISTSGSMSCLDTDPSDLTNDNECSVNIFSDNACATTVGNIPVHQVTTAEHKVDNGKWQSLNIECDLYNITSSEAFKAAVKTGKERWEKLLRKFKESDPKDLKGGDDLLKDYTEKFSNGKDKLPPPVDLRDELKALGTDTGNEYYFVELMGKNNGKVVFDDGYSVSQGVIIADNNDRDNDDRDEKKQLVLGEALYWEYKKFADQDGEDITKMQYHFRHSITNKATQEIIDEIYKNEGKDRKDTALEYTPVSDNFFALMGTPNGKATPIMLMNHSVALKRKSIKKIKIMQGDRYNFYFTVG